MPQVLIDLEIRQGDIWVVDGRDYPIKAIKAYQTAKFRGSAFHRMATVNATLVRMVPTGSAYTRTVIASLKCTPLDPQTYEGQRREVLKTPEALLQTYTSTSYGYYKLLLEDLKK